jgi:hypothetical protein
MNGQMIPYDDVRDSSAIYIVASTGNDIDVEDSSKSYNELMYSWSLIDRSSGIRVVVIASCLRSLAL